MRIGHSRGEDCNLEQVDCLNNVWHADLYFLSQARIVDTVHSKVYQFTYGKLHERH